MDDISIDISVKSLDVMTGNNKISSIHLRCGGEQEISKEQLKQIVDSFMDASLGGNRYGN